MFDIAKEWQMSKNDLYSFTAAEVIEYLNQTNRIIERNNKR
jgi:hypothetical protein